MNDQNGYRPEDDKTNGEGKGDFYGSDFREYKEAGGEPKENRYTYEAIKHDDKPKTRAYSIVSLILGIVSIFCCCSGFMPIICGILAIVFASIAKSHLGYFDGLALAGLILGIFGLLFGIAYIIGIVALNMDETFRNMIEEGLPSETPPDGNIGDSF